MKDKFTLRRVNSNCVLRMVSAISMRGADPRLEIVLRENCNLTYRVLPSWTTP